MGISTDATRTPTSYGNEDGASEKIATMDPVETEYLRWHQELIEVTERLDVRPSQSMGEPSVEGEMTLGKAADQEIPENPFIALETSVEILHNNFQSKKYQEILKGGRRDSYAAFEGTMVVKVEPTLESSKSIPLQVKACLAYLKEIKSSEHSQLDPAGLLQAQKLALWSLNYLLKYNMIEASTVQKAFAEDDELVRLVAAHLLGCFTVGLEDSFEHAFFDFPDQESLLASDETEHLHKVLSVFERTQWKGLFYESLVATYQQIKPDTNFDVTEPAISVLKATNSKKFYYGIGTEPSGEFIQTTQLLTELFSNPKRIQIKGVVGDQGLTTYYYIYLHLSNIANHADLGSLAASIISPENRKKLEVMQEIQKNILKLIYASKQIEKIKRPLESFKFMRTLNKDVSKSLRTYQHDLLMQVQAKIYLTNFYQTYNQEITKIRFWRRMQSDALRDDSQEMEVWFGNDYNRRLVELLEKACNNLKTIYGLELEKIEKKSSRLAKKILGLR